MSDAKDDVTYTATPCYYSRPILRIDPDALDKGLPFCATSPTIAISDIVMTSCRRDYSEQGGLRRERRRLGYTLDSETELLSMHRPPKKSGDMKKMGTKVTLGEVGRLMTLTDDAARLSFEIKLKVRAQIRHYHG